MLTIINDISDEEHVKRGYDLTSDEMRQALSNEWNYIHANREDVLEYDWIHLDFIDTITIEEIPDEFVGEWKKMLNYNTIIAGSFALSVYDKVHGRKTFTPGDIDVFTIQPWRKKISTFREEDYQYIYTNDPTFVDLLLRFDLDICRIGIIQRKDKYYFLTTPTFRLTWKTKKLFVPLSNNAKIKKRIKKYIARGYNLISKIEDIDDISDESSESTSYGEYDHYNDYTYDHEITECTSQLSDISLASISSRRRATNWRCW
jgi:hypothetical protein